MEKEKKILNAIGDIDEKYIEEARPEKVVRLTPKRSRKPLGVIAAAAVIIFGLGVYMKMNIHEQSATIMAPAISDGAASQENSAELSEDSDIPIEGTAGKTENDTVSEEKSIQSRTMIANPWKDSDSLSEAETDAGFKIVIPETLDEYTPSSYRSIKGDMLEIIYSDEESQEAFRIRKAPQSDEDISGDYNRYEFEKDLTVSDISVHIKRNDTDVFIATWAKDDFAYAVVVDENHHLTEDDISKLISEIG